MNNLVKKSLLILYRYMGPLILLAAVTWILKGFETSLQIQLIALLYLFPVLLSTALWGLWPGLLSGLLAFLCFNFFFLQPYYTFTVHKTQDVITLFVFLIVAALMSQLIGQAKTGTRLAKKREWEATRMYELIAALAGLTNEKDILLALKKCITDTFGFTQVEIKTPSDPIRIERAPSSEKMQKQLVVPMETRTKMIGEIWVNDPEIKLSFEERRLLHAFAYQGALAIERVHLVERENEARVFEESDRLKTSLLNSISHELRSPLAAIKASVSSLRIGAVKWDSPARKELLATVEEETDQLNLLVGNLLDMSRIEAGALLPKKQWNSLPEIVSSVVTRLNSQLAQNEIKLDFPGDLPLVATDYVMMEQVFSNLINNGIKYAPKGSPIVIKATKEKENMHIQVINQGPAVPDEHLEHIFDKFFRITKADKITGTGLGLSICKGIVEAHGGRIWAENLPEGFCFHILLPLMLNGEYPSIPEG
jgi:two-component system sensor histidine kinase KdpD